MEDCKYCHGSFYDDLKVGYLQPFERIADTKWEAVEIVKMLDDNTFRLRVFGNYDAFSKPLKRCPICGREFIGTGLNPWE